jgi:hypothetical protein
LENRPADRPANPFAVGLAHSKTEKKRKRKKEKEKEKEKKYLTSCHELCFHSYAVYDAEWSPVDRL